MQSASATTALYLPVAHIAQSLFVTTPETKRPYPAMHKLQSDEMPLPILVVVEPILQGFDAQFVCKPDANRE
jgi:hypothetical protein